MILPQLLVISSYLFVSSRCQEFNNYDYENSPNSVEFGAPSHTPRPTTRSPPAPYWWMNSAIFNNINKTTGGDDGKPGYKPGYKLGSKPGYKSKKCPDVPPLKSIKIYECEDWTMRCEYRPSKGSLYPLHCQLVPGTSEDF